MVDEGSSGESGIGQGAAARSMLTRCCLCGTRRERDGLRWAAQVAEGVGVLAVEVCEVDEPRPLGDGAFRAIATLRLAYPADVSNRLLDYVADLGNAEPVHAWRFWPAAAAAGWDGPVIEAFLKDCLNRSRAEVREAAASLAGLYKTLSPL